MGKLFRNILAVVVLLFTVSAAKADDILDKFHLERFVAVTHLSTSGVNIWVEVRNDWAHDLVIKRGSVDVMMHGNRVATIELRDKVVIPRRTTSRVLIPLPFDAYNTLSFQRILYNLVEKGGLGTTISYRVRAGMKLLKLTFSDKNVAVSEILNNFALSNDSLNELIELI
jgi:hypothetical protein